MVAAARQRRFQIPIGVLSRCSDRELLWILIKKTIDELFYDKIGIDLSQDDGDLASGRSKLFSQSGKFRSELAGIEQ